jgi:hypothetical protein
MELRVRAQHRRARFMFLYLPGGARIAPTAVMAKHEKGSDQDRAVIPGDPWNTPSQAEGERETAEENERRAGPRPDDERGADEPVRR